MSRRSVRVVTWNVNGIRARFAEVSELCASHSPDVLCLQEIKASPSQVPEPLTGLPAFWNHWHGAEGGYSGVSVHVARSLSSARPLIEIPAFDFETRIAVANLEAIGIPLRIASIYVPNGNKNFADKTKFLRALVDWAGDLDGGLIAAGDLNVAPTDNDVHPTMRKEGTIGQRPKERKAIAELLTNGEGLIDAIRSRWPDADDVFTWWPPWRSEKKKNRGWRIDFVLARPTFEISNVEILRDFGSSDHAPVLVDIKLSAAIDKF